MIPELLYESKQKIWRLQTDSAGKYMVLELRDEEYREVSFTAIDWKEGTILWEEGALDEPWWLSMAAVVEDKLLLHRLKEGQEPSPEALICLDISKGEGLWELENYLLEECYQNYLKCTFEEQEVIIDLDSGNKLSHPPPATLVLTSSHQLPSRYLPDDDYFTTVSTFIQRHYQQEPIGAIDYWEHESVIAMAYYVINNIHFDHYLMVLSREGELLHQLLLNQGTKGIGTESFGIQGDWLFYIQNKHSLYRIPLPLL